MTTNGPGRLLESAARLLYALLHAGDRARRAVKRAALVNRFGSHGEGFVFDPDGVYSFETIHVGDHVNLGYRPSLVATRSTIRLGSGVFLGPEVVIRGGNHRFDLPGIAMIDVTDDLKLPENDRGVVIEDDVWIGARAVILQGVTIGRGSIIGAGSVVTRAVPAYSVAAGVPARVIRDRFTAHELAAHESALARTAHRGAGRPRP